MMQIKHTAEMVLSDEMPVSIFADFLSRIPEDAKIHTSVNIEQPDRPGYSVHTTVTMRAEWGISV